VHGTGTHECVPLQGSGTFSVEAAIGTIVPRNGHVLVPSNGAYCQRLAKICKVLGRKLTTIDYTEDKQVRPPTSTARWPPTRASRTWRWCIAKPAPACSTRCTRSRWWLPSTGAA
jgi:hypothetical protein